MLFPELRELIKLKTLVGVATLLQDRTGNRTQGDYASLFHGLGVEFETVRPYVVGDDVRYIDWRVTARSGKPHIKTFRAECDRNVLVVVDANAYMRFGTRDTFKSIKAASTAALLCWKSLQQQDRVGGAIFGDTHKGIQYFKPAKHDSTVLRLLKTLCSKESNVHPPVPVATALKHITQITPPQSLVFIISDFSNDSIDDLEKALLALRKRCTVILLPIYDPADSEIPAIGAIIAADGKQNFAINTYDIAARRRYHAAWQQYQQNLTQLSKRLKAPLLWIATVTDPIKTLFRMQGSTPTWKT